MVWKGNSEAILIICPVDVDTSLKERDLVWISGEDEDTHQWIHYKYLEGEGFQTHTGNIPPTLILGQSSSSMCTLKHECWAFSGVSEQRPAPFAGGFSLFLEPSWAIPDAAGMTEQGEPVLAPAGAGLPVSLRTCCVWMWMCVPCSQPWVHKACSKQSEWPDIFL